MCHRNPAKLADNASTSKSITRKLHIKGINNLNDTHLYPSIGQIPRFLSSQPHSVLPQGLRH